MTLPIALTVVSGVMSAVGAIQEGNARAAAANYNAKLDMRNRAIADQDRKYNTQLALIEAEDKKRENARTISSIRTAYGSSGFDVAGSPLDVLEDSAMELSLDASRIEYEGRIRNREGGIKMQEFASRAVLSRMEAKSAKTAGRISAVGYLAGTGAKALNMAGESLTRTG